MIPRLPSRVVLGYSVLALLIGTDCVPRPIDSEPVRASALTPSSSSGTPPMSNSSQNSVVDPVPQLDGDRYVIDFPPHRVEVEPKLGARITAFRLDGKNAFAEQNDSPVAFGVSFWPSPQQAWNWPPPEEFDQQPYDAEIRGSTLVLTSRPSARVGLRATKEISADPARGAAQIVYGIENVGSAPTRVAPWENARTRPHGVTFFPINGAAHSASTLAIDSKDALGWLAHDPARYTKNGKFFADGREGWLANTDGALLLVFAFDDVPAGSEAPGEGEIEIYVDGAGKFVEVEHQGPYTELAPGASLRWRVTWLLERLPAGLDVRAGSRALVEHARRLADRAR